MKRRNVLFVLCVFGFLGLGILRERERRSDPKALVSFSEPADPTFDALVPPSGNERLYGRVLDREGVPVEGLEVFLFAAELEPGAASPLHWTLTDEEGEFSLDRLEARRYDVVLFQPGRKPEELEVQVPSPVGVMWRLEEEPLGPLEALPPVTRIDLVGRVRVPADHADAASLEPQGYEVVLVPKEDDPLALTGAARRRAVVDAQGIFRFEQVVTSSYRLELLPPWARSGSWPVLDGVELELAHGGFASPVLSIRGGSVTGALRDTEGRPIEGALVQLWPADHPDRPWPATTTDVDGSFRIGDLPAGPYQLEIRAGAARHEVAFTAREGVVHRIPLDPMDPRR